MEQQVTDPIEQKLQTLADLDYVKSFIVPGQTQMTVTLRDATPPDVVLLHTSVPRHGVVSLGIEVNVLPAAVEGLGGAVGPAATAVAVAALTLGEQGVWLAWGLFGAGALRVWTGLK